MSHISKHDHPMHKGPHDHYIHPDNKGGMKDMYANKGDHALGDKSHIKSVMGEPSGKDVAGHKGKMHW